MLTFIQKLLAPPPFEDEDKNRKARMLSFISMPFAILLGLFILTHLVLNDSFSVNNLFLVLGLVGVFWLARRGWVAPAGILLVGMSWGLLTSQGWRAGGIRDSAIIAYLIIILLAHLLLGWRYGLGMTLLSVAAGWGLAYAEVSGMIKGGTDPAYEIALEFSLLFILATIIVTTATSSLQEALKRARENESELAVSNRELRGLQTSLEERVLERTRGLETVAALSESLGAILQLDQLLAGLVNRIQEVFGYYHVHVYMFDDRRQNLFVAEGAGPAGQAMKGRHSIPADASSLVARAARSGQVVRVDNVREAKDWQPNPLLPETRAEMAVPIVVEKQVMGVLDVQVDEVGGLDDGDAFLLRSLAGQAAVAVRNARLFAEVEKALEDTRLSQERYIEQSWTKTRQTTPGAYRYVKPGAAPLAPETLAAATREALAQKKAAILTPGQTDPFGGDQEASARPEWKDGDGNGLLPVHTILAPVVLKDTVIGAFQLHRTGPDGQPQPWTEHEAGLVEAVLDQVAQAAENLRLFNDVREQANFEGLLGQITQKLRQAPNMESLAKTAAEELGKVLGASHSQVRVGGQAETGPDNNGTVERNGHK